MKIPMIFRFCLYGFLKNQRYFEPFLVLALLEKEFDFLLVGTAIAVRAVTVTLLEIPSGAIADACGRRGAMVLSFAAYIISFVIFGLVNGQAAVFAAMVFFGVGDAFRSGTHKAMIFEWLSREGRLEERTRIYGYTRSWSKLGSALSSLLAALFVLLSDSYTTVFLFATIPYLINIANFAGYPKELDGDHEKASRPAEVMGHLREALADAFRQRPLRRLIGESMAWEGVFSAVKDYLQPVLQTAVLAGVMLPVLSGSLSDTQHTAVLIGPVYFVLFLISAAASRLSHRLVEHSESEEAAARHLWAINSLLFVILTWAAWGDNLRVAVVLFVALYALQNLWRPILISRLDRYSKNSQGATVLSIESQAQRGATMILAPILGWAVDSIQARGPGGAFWPIGALGAVTAILCLVTSQRRRSNDAS